MGIFLRWLFALVLVTATFNPTQWNYTRWAMENYDTETPVTVLAGLVLLIGYVIYIRATMRSIGWFGISLVAAVVGALIWVLIDWQMLTLENQDLNVWLGIFALSVVLGIGLSWSIVRRALSGQFDVDDYDDE
ncbi:MAG: hypothetical protein GY945_05655 [Rhodobacteraceae bacterium]|nr:hypothetical protein [Paracoccaceae bacterium]